MANGKNCFIQTVKLPHVRGRVRYISDPRRQENLYATYSNVDPKFWRYLSKENQADFIRSGTKGKCIEARELMVPVFQGGELVYQVPDLQASRAYCQRQVDSLWDEVKRFENPHNYYVDLSQKLWDIKQALLNSHEMK